MNMKILEYLWFLEIKTAKMFTSLKNIVLNAPDGLVLLNYD